MPHAERTPSVFRSAALVMAASFGLGGAVVLSNVVAPDAPLSTPRAEAQLLDPSQPYAISDVAERVLPAVVSVTTKVQMEVPPMFRSFDPFFDMGPGQRQRTGEGSGVIVDAKKGLVLTNNHVVAGSSEIVVTLSDGTDVPAEIVGTDPPTDVAVLRLTPDGPMPDLSEIEIGDSNAVRLGEIVLAIGNPFGMEGTVTMGIVSAKGRSQPVGGEGARYTDYIQTDAAINPGNSGGALVNMRGELVGVPTMIMSRTGGSAGIGFSIPTHIAVPVMDGLVENGAVTRGYLGIAMQPLKDPDLAEELGAKGRKGVIVADVVEDSPAAKGDLRAGDVIVAIDGERMDSRARVATAVALRPPGSRVAVDVIRDGKERSLKVTLGQQPDGFLTASLRGATPDAKAEPVDGVRVAPLDDSARATFEIPDEVVAGAVVQSVEEGSMIARSGLRPGDVVIEVNRKPVKSVRDFETLWASSKDRVMLRVKRGRGTMFLMLSK
mgnify:CR=1 FL=1